MKKKLILGSIFAFASAGMFAQSWSLLGNPGTIDGTNFIGTTDNVPFGIRVNNVNSGRIDHILHNTFFGYTSGNSSTTGFQNCSYGSFALSVNTSGNVNTAIGAYALYRNTTGSANVAVGTAALFNNTTGYTNIGIGANTLGSNNGHDNVGIGSLFSSTAGNYNTGINYALVYNSTGNNNTSVGYQSLLFNTSGDDNTSIGSACLFNNITGTKNTGLGVNADLNAGNLNNATTIGYNTLNTSSDKVRVGDANVTVIEGQVAWSFPSDGRFKNNVSEDDVKGLDFIKLLRPVVYNFDSRKFTEFLTKNMADSIAGKYLKTDFTNSTKIRQSGFIAQEVEKAANEVGYNFNGVHKPNNENDNYSLAYGQFVVPLVKAVQEQQQMIENLKSEINELKKSKNQANLTGVGEVKTEVKGVSLEQNIPNPFTNETVIKYSLPANTGAAYLAISDLTGKQLMSFPINKDNSSSMRITTEKLAAGIYIYSLVADGKLLDSKRMVVAEK